MTTPWRPKPPPVTPESIARADAEATRAWDAVHALRLQLYARGDRLGLDWHWPNPIPDPEDAPADLRRLTSRYWDLVGKAQAKGDVVRALWADIL